MIHWEAIAFFILTLLLMGFFAGIEMAYYSANRMTIEINKRQGGRSGQILSRFVQEPAGFLGTTLIGYTIFLVFLGLEASSVMHPIWNYLDIGSELVHSLLEIALTTLIVLVLAEFIPRAWFRARSNKLIHGLAWVIAIFYMIFQPIASGLIRLSEWVLKYVFNIQYDQTKEPFLRSDLKHLFQPGEEEDGQDLSTQLMENAQELPKIKIRQCLVPRKEIIGVESHSTIEDVKNIFIETKLSKLVVYENTIDHIKGYIHQLDLFKKPGSIESVLHPIPAVPESMSASDLISKLTKERKSIAWVVDEFGGTAGIITMEDVLEELFGEIRDEYDTQEFIERQLSENEYIFSGRLELDYIENKYGLNFGDKESETLSGHIIHFHEMIPRQKERIIIDDYEFEIMTVNDTRIELVKMKKLK